ncbi:BatA domain-containing protein [Puia sp.]|uniref:BatA domain-containing protein n=1 Tax=Puia sp. TaxID=2045100 RepID=UPI002F414542
MIQFLQPIGLLAMAGVLIPVIVHLWNDRRGKVLRIGSVALLTGTSRRAAWSPRLTQLLLLILRCLLVIALAMLLAGPYVIRPAAAGKGWVLVAGNNVLADSLVKMGYERYVIDSGQDYWEAFRRADALAPAGATFFVFTPGLVSRFAGDRPETKREVHWKVYPPVDSVNRWVEGVWRVTADSILVLRGIGRSTGTEFRRERVVSRATEYEGVVVDTAAMEVVIDDGGNRQDGDYLRAALRALGDYTGRRLRVVSAGTNHAQVIRCRPEWAAAAWNGRLPVVLGREVFGRMGIVEMDRRVIDAEQVAPVRVNYAVVRTDGGRTDGGGPDRERTYNERIDLRPVLWAIVFGLFVLERIKVFRDGRQKA